MGGCHRPCTRRQRDERRIFVCHPGRDRSFAYYSPTFALRGEWTDDLMAVVLTYQSFG